MAVFARSSSRAYWRCVIPSAATTSSGVRCSSQRSAHLRAARKQLRDEWLGGLPDLRNLHLKLAVGGLHPARPKAVAKSRVKVAQPALIVGPALIARAAYAVPLTGPAIYSTSETPPGSRETLAVDEEEAYDRCLPA
jgi:hypothetical protein